MPANSTRGVAADAVAIAASEAKSVQPPRPVIPLATWARRTPPSVRRFLAFTGGLVVAFSLPLISLARHAAGSSLHSHILLVPFVSLYLLAVQRRRLPTEFQSSLAPGMAFGIGGLAVLGAAWWFGSASKLSENDHLALMALSFLCLLVAGGHVFLGTRWMKAAMFPVAFLLFMIPLPDQVVIWLETGSKLASAEAAAMLFNLTGMPVLRDGTVFQLPGIRLEVAQECSGIRSSWVLFITSLVASHMFLETRWRRIALVALVIPLGILRNGFRIVVIGWLCVEVGLHMIDSVIHRRGGPVFFALSLIPLFFLLWWLRRAETRRLDRKCC